MIEHLTTSSPINGRLHPTSSIADRQTQPDDTHKYALLVEIIRSALALLIRLAQPTGERKGEGAEEPQGDAPIRRQNIVEPLARDAERAD